MPPMPANAVLVHELENKLEINAKPEPAAQSAPEKSTIATSLPPSQATTVPPVPSTTETSTSAPAPVLPSSSTTSSTGISQQNYNQYGMAGMYNYPSAAARN